MVFYLNAKLHGTQGQLSDVLPVLNIVLSDYFIVVFEFAARNLRR